jgi:hypothetical protein
MMKRDMQGLLQAFCQQFQPTACRGQFAFQRRLCLCTFASFPRDVRFCKDFIEAVEKYDCKEFYVRLFVEYT